MPSLRMAPQIMTLTPAAARRIRSILADRSDGTLGLRIGVKKGGCAGMEYTLTWATSVTPGDEVVEADGATVLIEPAAVLYLIGTEMDFRTDKLSSQFVFKNPNQKSACGCGESVNLVPATTAGRG